MAKKVYSCIVFFESGTPKSWKYVSNLKSFTDFLNKSHTSWKYFNVYDKATREYLKRFYPGNIVPKILGSILLLLVVLLPSSHLISSTFILKQPLNTCPMTFIKTTFINGFNNSATIPTLFDQKGGSKC